MATVETQLRKIKEAVASKVTESAQVRGIAKELAAMGSYVEPDVHETRTNTGSVVRFYFYDKTPAGSFALITGPAIEGEIKTAKQLAATDPEGEFAVYAAPTTSKVAAAARQATKAGVKAAKREGSASPARAPRAPAAPRKAAAPKAPSLPPLPPMVELLMPSLNKQDHIEDYLKQLAPGAARPAPLVKGGIIETKKLTTAQFDDLAHNLLTGHAWMKGKGGHDTTDPGLRAADKDWQHLTEDERALFKRTVYTLVIKVEAPNRPPLYIDPEGYDYARYVLFAPNTVQAFFDLYGAPKKVSAEQIVATLRGQGYQQRANDLAHYYNISVEQLWELLKPYVASGEISYSSDDSGYPGYRYYRIQSDDTVPAVPHKSGWNTYAAWYKWQGGADSRPHVFFQPSDHEAARYVRETLTPSQQEVRKSAKLAKLVRATGEPQAYAPPPAAPARRPAPARPAPAPVAAEPSDEQRMQLLSQLIKQAVAEL